MIMIFLDKSKLPYEEHDYDFICPMSNSDDVIIRQYWSADNLNTPSAGDMVIILGKFYKVFSTVFDYDKKTVYVTVEEL